MGAPDGYRGRQPGGQSIKGGVRKRWHLGAWNKAWRKRHGSRGQGGKESGKKSMQAKERASAKQRGPDSRC